MATPFDILLKMNTGNEFDNPVATAVTMNKKADMISNRFLPNRSLNNPKIMEPIKQPNNAQLIAQPISKEVVRSKNFS